MASAQAARHESSDEDEWEYEYDENETEDYYVTLDLTTHIHKKDRQTFPDRIKEEPISSQTRNARRPRGRKDPRDHRKKQKAAAEEEDEEEEEEDEDEDEDEEGNAGNDQNASDNDKESGGEEDAHTADLEGLQDTGALANEDEDENYTPRKPRQRKTAPKSASKSASTPKPNDPSKPQSIQILELASSNPLLSRNGKVYSCNWASSVGTDMLFAGPETRFPEPGADPPSDAQLLACTRHRLIAKPAKLTAHSADKQKPWKTPVREQLGLDKDDDAAEEPEEPEEEAEEEDARFAKNRDQQALIAKAKATHKQKVTDQEDFITQFSKLRAEKGEDDFVPMNKSDLMRPRNSRRARAGSSLAASAEVGERNPWTGVGRGRGRGRGRGAGRGRGTSGGRGRGASTANATASGVFPPSTFASNLNSTPGVRSGSLWDQELNVRPPTAQMGVAAAGGSTATTGTPQTANTPPSNAAQASTARTSAPTQSGETSIANISHPALAPVLNGAADSITPVTAPSTTQQTAASAPQTTTHPVDASVVPPAPTVQMTDSTEADNVPGTVVHPTPEDLGSIRPTGTGRRATPGGMEGDPAAGGWQEATETNGRKFEEQQEA